ncbi:seryl-trna synthetase [Moniliophthora roreri]|nr:seryl-trna synthetase [Moniliophthora roreri]
MPVSVFCRMCRIYTTEPSKAIQGDVLLADGPGGDNGLEFGREELRAGGSVGSGKDAYVFQEVTSLQHKSCNGIPWSICSLASEQREDAYQTLVKSLSMFHDQLYSDWQSSSWSISTLFFRTSHFNSGRNTQFTIPSFLTITVIEHFWWHAQMRDVKICLQCFHATEIGQQLAIFLNLGPQHSCSSASRRCLQTSTQYLDTAL